MGLSEALTEGDVNAVEKATDPGDNTKACGSKSKSDADVDEDSEGNESASEIEVQAPVDKKASRMENKKKVREQKGEARKNKVLKAVKKGGRSWPKPIRLGSRLRLWY